MYSILLLHSLSGIVFQSESQNMLITIMFYRFIIIIHIDITSS